VFAERLRRWIAAGRPPLVVAWQARSLVEAQVLEAVLRQAGIRVLVRRRSVPGYEGVVERAEGVWADLLVDEPDRDRARALAAGFLATPPEA
jgi:hypothetical protein